MKIEPVIPESVPALHNSDDSSILVSAPAFSFTLRFLDPKLEESFQEFQCEKVSSNLSLYPSPKERFLLFGTLFITTPLLTALSYISDQQLHDLSDEVLAIQLIGLLILISAGICLLGITYRMKQRPRVALRLLSGLYLITAILYIGLDSSLVYRVVEDQQVTPVFVGLIPLLVTTLQMQYLFGSEFCFFGATSILVSGIHLGVHLAVEDRGKSQVLLETGVVIACAIFFTRRLYTVEKAVRLAFLLEKSEAKTHKTSRSSMSVPANSSISHNTDLEEIITKINNVHATLTDACSLVTYQDLRGRLKAALKDLDIASAKLAVQAPNLASRVDRINQEIDEEDRVFVQQNFMMTKASDFASQAGPATEREVVSLNISLEYGLEELLAVMSKLGKNWNFDMFFLQEITQGKPISVSGRYCLSKYDLSSKFSIADATAQSFFSALEGQYKNNPYHNNIHGADVLNSTFFLLNSSFVIGQMTDVEILGAIIATLGHDVGHGALTNRFLVNSRDGLAISCMLHTDNDISVLEMMHASMTYSLLQVQDQNMLSNLDNDSWMLARKVVLKMILATDMARHFELLGAFRATHSTVNPTLVSKIDERIVVSEMCIKAADIGHAAKSIDLHEKWTLLVCEEFYQQGDLEKKLGLPVSMYCDRETTDIAKVLIIQSQQGFIQNIVLPLYECLNAFLGSKAIESFCIEQLRANMTAWEKKTKKKRRFTIKSKPIPVKNEFQKLSDKIRNSTRG